jgi:hypothetical protein
MSHECEARRRQSNLDRVIVRDAEFVLARGIADYGMLDCLARTSQDAEVSVSADWINAFGATVWKVANGAHTPILAQRTEF